MTAMVTALAQLTHLARHPQHRQPVELTIVAQGSWALLDLAKPKRPAH